MGKPADRNVEYMHSTWGTTKLVTDYQESELISEIMNDDYREKNTKFKCQNELHQRIRNDDDYDDWTYGMEPVSLIG